LKTVNEMKVFISSVHAGLEPERKAVIDAILNLQHEPIAMEHFSASPEPPLEECLSRVEESDILILILGLSYGSIHTGTGLSYTENEYRHAKKLGLEVLGFWVQGLESKIDGANPPESAEKYARFVADVKPSVTLRPFSNPDQLATALVTGIHNYESRHGELGRRSNLFATREDYFASQLDASLYLNQTWEFVGREDTLGKLEEFVTSDKKVCLLYGSGGIGKSKILYEFSKSFDEEKSGWDLRFVKQSVPWHADAPRGLTARPCVIVLDDAQRYADLAPLLGLLQSGQYADRTKIILAARPSGKSAVESLVFREVDVSEVETLKPLKALRREDVLKLALQALDAQTTCYAERLVQVSWDCPLVTVVGGRLIKEKKLQPEQFPSDDDFRREVLSRFTVEVTSALPEPRDLWDKILSLLAALEPVRPESDEFRTQAAKFLGTEPWDLFKRFDTLEEHGLLARRGGLVWISPDVLADFILQEACVTRKNEDNRYAKRVFEEFAGRHARNLLRNLAELQWRIDLAAKKPQLLETIWEDIFREFRAADYASRVHILTIIEPAAALQPIQALQLVREATTLD
jgi:hypothetical protein